MRASGAEAIAEWVSDCKRECEAFGLRLTTLVISAKNEALTIAPLFYASPPLSSAIFSVDDETKCVHFLGVKLRFTEKLPEGKFWMVMSKEKKNG